MLYSISYILILIITIFYQNNNNGFRANHSAGLEAIKLVDYIVHEIDMKLTHELWIAFIGYTCKSRFKVTEKTCQNHV